MRFICSALSASALVGVAALSGCDGYCVNSRCVTEVSTTLFIARTPSELDGAGIQLCRNGGCIEGVLRLEIHRDESGEETGRRLRCGVPEGHSCNGTLSGSSSTVLLIAHSLGEGEDEVEIEDGDVYSATVTPPDDADSVLASREGPVNYTRDDPACDTVCYTATY